MSDWEHDVETPDVKSWMEEARILQQNMYLRLGDREWDEWDRLDKTILLQKVGFGLYPLPKNNINTMYNKKQKKKIELIADVILENAKNGKIIHFACIFLFGKSNDYRFFIPVFKVKGKQNQTLFVDTDRHIYEKWQDYLNSNRLPKCMYCYPHDGLYQGEGGQVLIDFDTSPACDPKSGILSIHDTTTKITVATSVIMTSLFPAPITTPISEVIQVTSDSIGFYDTPQSATNMENPQFEDQRVGLNESEENMDELQVLKKFALNMAQDRIRASITQVAAAGHVFRHDLSCHQQRIIQPINAVVTTDIFRLIDNADKNAPTEGDVSYFSAYFLFYSNQVLKKDIVKKIIKNTQQKILNCHCDDMTDQQIDEYFKLSESVKGISQLHKNARKIKAINHIKDKQAFYGNLVIASRELKNHHVQFSFHDPGLVNIDNELHIAPSKLIQISETDRQQILEATQKMKSDMKNDSYRKNVEKILKENRVKMEYQRCEAIVQLKKAFETKYLKTVKIGNMQIFKNMTPSELDRLANVMEVFSKTYDFRVLKIVNEFAKMRHCKTPRDYCNYVEFIAEYVNELKRPKEGEYLKALHEAKANNEGFIRTRFDSDYGIKGKSAAHFRNQVLDNFETSPEESFSALEERYSKIESVVQPLNENADPNFASIASAVCHYFKHADFGAIRLTEEEYFKIAAELVSEPLNKRSTILNQQGDKMITFENPINGAKGVLFETLTDGTQSLATVFYNKKVLKKPE